MRVVLCAEMIVLYTHRHYSKKVGRRKKKGRQGNNGSSTQRDDSNRANISSMADDLVCVLCAQSAFKTTAAVTVKSAIERR